jgi:transposase
MMSGAVWVRDRLRAAGWQVEVADARKVKAIAPLACKTDKVDARVLAELCRRALVPAVWVPSFSDRELRERLNRRADLIRLRTAAKNRVFGALSQGGLRIPLGVLRSGDPMTLLEKRGLPEVWRRSVAKALAVIDILDARIAPLEAELRTLAHADSRVQLLLTVPGVGEHLGLMMAAEIGDVSRFPGPRNLIGFAGLAPRAARSGQSSRTGALSKAGSRTLRWAAIEAAQCAWRPTNPWNRLYMDVKQRTGKSKPRQSAVARKVLIAAWHVLAPQEPFKPSSMRRGHDPVPASSHFHLAA